MIVYALTCKQGHSFEGWFASSQACEQQAADGLLECPTCSSPDIRKLPAAPYVKGATSAPEPEAVEQQAQLRLKVLAALRTHILATTEDVGRAFAEVARRIHYEEEKARNIRGQVTTDEAAELLEEGVEAYAISPELLPPSGEIH